MLFCTTDAFHNRIRNDSSQMFSASVCVCVHVRWNPEVPIEGLKEALQLMVEGLPETEVAIRVSCPESFPSDSKSGRYTSIRTHAGA